MGIKMIKTEKFRAYGQQTINPVFIEFLDLQISGGACGLVLTANAVMFLTIFGFFLAFDNDDVQYAVW